MADGPANAKADSSGAPAGFPAPSSLEIAKGTEGAQAAYPYYMQFAPEDDDRF